jgi:hypothetical protein
LFFDAEQPLVLRQVLVGRWWWHRDQRLEYSYVTTIKLIIFQDWSPGSSPTKPKPSLALRSGSGLSYYKPEPTQAQPKPGLAHHYLS